VVYQDGYYWSTSDPTSIHQLRPTRRNTDHRPINIYPDAVPPIHAVSSHVATDKDPSM